MTHDWKGESLIHVAPDPHAARGLNLKQPVKHYKPKHKALPADIVARREKVSGLVRRGESVTRIAELLKISYSIIYHDCKVMNLLPSNVVS